MNLEAIRLGGDLSPSDYKAMLRRAFPQAEDLYFFEMTLIRYFEQALLRLFSENRLFGTTHTSLGQECNAVGIVNQLDCGRDVIWSNHRCHGHFLAYSGEVLRLFAEIMGKAAGVSGGRGGSQHICYHRFYSNGIQGGITPQAVGSSYALKQTGAVAVAFIGDGTLGEGVLYESLNMASLWNCPVLFVVEDNGIAQTTPSSLAVSGSPADRAAAFGIRGFRLDTPDVMAVASLAAEAVGYVRGTGRPAWMYLPSIRLGPHSKGDDTRPAEAVAALRDRDPLVLHRQRIARPAVIEELCTRLVAGALDAATALDDATG
jgi:TPP-dependent pyruvate/acetoin dehydrogenase alpha subunit